MLDPRQQRIEVYEDTMRLCQEDEVLSAAIHASIEGTVFYPMGKSPTEMTGQNRAGKISVTSERTLQAAQRLHHEHPGTRIAILNFASATNPGGGVERGSSAQEESICRCSTLHPCLKTEELWDSYYLFHRQRQDVRYTDACIYTPDIYAMKTDTAVPSLMPRDVWFKVDVITCAAPNLRERPYNPMNPGHGHAVKVTDEDLMQIHIERGTKIVKVAAAHGADIMVLGAFGCGAFCNDPIVVTKAYIEVMKQYRSLFDETIFAVYCPPHDSTNYDTFRHLLGV